MSDQLNDSTTNGTVIVPPLNQPGNSISTAIPGAVTQQIGSGEHAQNSIVYRTILWSFVGGGLLSAASIAIALNLKATLPFSELKDIWSIFVPLITLALGYLFGKGR